MRKASADFSEKSVEDAILELQISRQRLGTIFNYISADIKHCCFVMLMLMLMSHRFTLHILMLMLMFMLMLMSQV